MMSKKQFYIFTTILLGSMIIFFVKVNIQEQERQRIQNGEIGGKYYRVASAEIVDLTVDPTLIPQIEEIEEETEIGIYGDENNYIYPYNLMSADWGSDEIEGFNYYNIPTEYEEAGGCFPEVVQVFTYLISKDTNLEYPMAIALIERESGYKYDAMGDDGASKGYMQVMEKWHIERMERLGVSDLLNPYHNIVTGVDFLNEILEKYPDINKALMVYNIGETGAKRLWSKGIHQSNYSKGIIERAQEIEQELQD